jgi:hypothetical protein
MRASGSQTQKNGTKNVAAISGSTMQSSQASCCRSGGRARTSRPTVAPQMVTAPPRTATPETTAIPGTHHASGRTTGARPAAMSS